MTKARVLEILARAIANSPASQERPLTKSELYTIVSSAALEAADEEYSDYLGDDA